MEHALGGRSFVRWTRFAAIYSDFESGKATRATGFESSGSNHRVSIGLAICTTGEDCLTCSLTPSGLLAHTVQQTDLWAPVHHH